MPYQFLSPIDRGRTLGIYIHIPFCVRKCGYCDFYSLPAGEWTGEPMAQFQQVMLDWLDWWSGQVKGREVDTVYIGGGTPSCYPVKFLAALINRVRDGFCLTADCEITVECNPDSASGSWLKTMRGCGVNRLSMGVQSANDEELRASGRLHDFSQAKQAYHTAREVGFDNISLDIIYGLPGQSMQAWQNSVETLLALQPDHLSCYGLTVEEGTPFARNRKKLTLADDDLQADMYLWMVQRLERAGYGQYEISNYARPNCHSRHNMRYWLGQEYICVGPSAHGFIDGIRFSVARDLKRFYSAPISDVLHSEQAEMDLEEQVRELVLLRMRTVLGLSRQGYEQCAAKSFAPLEARLRQFARQGWAEQTDGRWHFTAQGFLVSNALILQLLELVEEQFAE